MVLFVMSAISQLYYRALRLVTGDDTAKDVESRLNGTFPDNVSVGGTLAVTGAATFTGALTANGGVVRSVTHKYHLTGKVGGSAGWAAAGANDNAAIATMAASQTAGTLVVPLDGLQVGSTITGFKITASVNSGGGTVTIDCALKSYTPAAAATGTAATIDTMTQVSVTAPTAVAQSKTGLSTVVVSGTRYFLLLTATTGAGCTIELNEVEVTVTTG